MQKYVKWEINYQQERPPPRAVQSWFQNLISGLDRAVKSLARSHRTALGLGTAERPDQPDQVSGAVLRS